MSKKNKEIVSDKKLKSYTVNIVGTDRNHINIYNDACHRFLTDDLQDILMLIKK